VKKKVEKEKSIRSIINKNKIGKINKNNNSSKKDNIDSQNRKNKSRPKTGIRQQKKNNKFFENNKKFGFNPFKDNAYEENENKKINNINNIKNINDEDNSQKPSISVQSRGTKETNINSIGNGTGNISFVSKSKGKKSNNFVNEKMVIKPDPNKSIFKAIPNPAFFNQGNKKNNNDIVVMVKGKPIKSNQNKNINKNNINIVNKNIEDIQDENEENNNNSNYNIDKNDLSPQENNEVNYINKDKDNNLNPKKLSDKKKFPKKNEPEQKKEDLRYKNFFNNDKENDNIIEENIDNDKIIENKYQENERRNFKKENENEVEGVDLKIIQKLLTQMDFLTKGHNSLENMFDNIQMDTQEQIENLNENFGKLESKTNRLNKDLNDYCINGS